ncbi:MAG: FkbM family methyltransferase [Chitinophagaceae bacterium]|nr:FkbM family methyltransferase [Chitinophagaceae bacterium]
MRKLIRSVLQIFGYDIIKVNVHSDQKKNRIKKVMVGNYLLEMPGNNPQISTYKYDPSANSQLGRLSACIASKYPSLSVLDVGANVGDTIAIIKSAIELPVIGIEGDDFAFEFLKKNTMSLKNVTLIKTFLGEKIESKRISMEKTGWNTTLIPNEEQGEMVHLKTLDEVLGEEHLLNRTLKLLKIDCEGFDTIIIRGSAKLIREKKPVIYFEYNRTNMEAIQEEGLSTLLTLGEVGYKNVILFVNKGRYLMKVPIDQVGILEDLHRYAKDGGSCIAYYDICLFHEDDSELAAAFIASENLLHP